MKKTLLIISFLSFFALTGKAQEKKQDTKSLPAQYQEMMTKILGHFPKAATSTATQMLDFAKSMIGVPYRYATSNPDKGFDCSGFVNYVFSSFGFKVPRSSPEFASAGVPVKLADAKVGDVLIFTGTNPRVRRIGHVGIIYSIEGDEIKFIHSTSGKANGVTVTEFNDYYKSRFMKAVSIVE
ncbi:MAG: NlpC/P60 family protein [Pedobacter sp.]|nr:MAG: NlpC/P60 family protein [Pedobacter sp.]